MVGIFAPVLAGAVLAALPAAASAAPAVPSTAPAFIVYTGYADCPSLSTCSATKVSSPNFPSPWLGPKNVAFIGDPNQANLRSTGDPDSSAIRIFNSGTADITVNDVSVSGCNSGSALDLWGTAPFAYPYTVPTKSSIIFSSTSGDNFDGSEICSGLVKVTVNINGVKTTYKDNIANGGDGGIFGGSGRPFNDESTPWTKVSPGTNTAKIAPASLPNATSNTPYNTMIAAEDTNGKPTYTLKSGALPPGLNLVADSVYLSAADITGTPTTPGSYTFTVGVKDTNVPPDKGAKKYTIVVS
jgi:hypothetical protein